MTQREINESNKLIAEFMGLIQCGSPYNNSFTVESNDITSFAQFCRSKMKGESWYVYPKFNTSWSWLVPVVHKIYGNLSSPIQLANLELSWSRKDINEIFQAVVRYIKQYNTQTK